MAPKNYRAAPVSARHSRSTSATKLPTNLQFTQQKKAPPPPKQARGQKQRPGFHIASPGEEEDEDDWVSSESGAVTPNPHDDDNQDSDLESQESIDNLPPTRRSTLEAAPKPPNLPRVPTARPSDYRNVAAEVGSQRAAPAPTRIDTAMAEGARTAYRESPTPMTPTTAPPSEAASPTRRRRPMSSHSMNKIELRPHPLIRGQSFGLPSVAPKPSPLMPVAITADVGQLPPSPSSSAAPARRTSISSARSVATIATTHPAPPRSMRESARNRTFSTLSTANSSAALSSLTHLPAVSRPPSPQMIAFFPPNNPHVRVDDIHPLLPPPYVTNHLTVLARRTPIREAFDRVIRARQSARA
ncbi:hypothetical protein R3P38DRAFT_2840846 [Favolaschia claudopus]|uniref:Uncharacterized protein n=1 Tax=Favolaschia claudopus TaxID=2862362 RepID=A0AAW0DYK8_9AGAR